MMFRGSMPLRLLMSLSNTTSDCTCASEYAAELPSITWFQEELAKLGYPTPQTGENKRLSTFMAVGGMVSRG